MQQFYETVSFLTRGLLDRGISEAEAAKNLAAFYRTTYLFNNTAKSGARAYANIELPLADVKAVANATNTYVNRLFRKWSAGKGGGYPVDGVVSVS